MGNENIVLTSGEPKLPVARFEFKDSSQKSACRSSGFPLRNPQQPAPGFLWQGC